ncbi:signal peptidase I [Actinoplanes subtropicus]|uniref:signal peptidase I n=1 Tax=Actinoplanes subtropicus TaxID=543632 RepID=UPI000ACB4033|nr:signal peptidase I [Actinoplanes subtropicus]
MGSPQLTRAVPPTSAGRYRPAAPPSRYAADTVRFLAQLVLAIVACMTVAGVVPALFGWHSYVVCSGSMVPSLAVGDVAIAAPVRPGDIAPGRIVVFQAPGQPGRLLVHRIQGLQPDGRVLTKGDANAAADSTPVRPDTVRGLVRLRLPMVGLPLHWWQTKDWAPAIGGVALLVSLVLIASPRYQPPKHLRAGPRHGRTAARRAAATALVDRLPAVGHVRRTRDPQDRRRVTVRTSETAMTVASAFFVPLGRRRHEAAADVGDEEVARTAEIVRRLTNAVTDASRDRD